ncbi:DoxX family protein [Actinomadura sp. 1N219]|uniref:DoxX family protein n=1 Tax=Actinomadura sp. 1N219 TaxID=3375152 RepID=UPI0037B9D2E5
MEAGLLIIRVAVGVIMFYHGTEKLFGWWGGEGVGGAAEFFGRQGYRAPRLTAAVAGLTESAGGLLLAAGLLTPLGAVMLIGVFVNIMILHLPNGLSRRRNGCEYELVLMAATCCIAFTGPGTAAADGALGLDLNGAGWGGAVTAIGVLSGLAVSASRARSRRPGSRTVRAEAG